MSTKAFAGRPALAGEWRTPRQMLGDQEYDGHVSIHDDSMAQELGFNGGPIEGPTHFSQFAPLLHECFGAAFFERGCLSAHYQNMVVEGEAVRAFAHREGDDRAAIWAEKRDGTPVLTGTATLGPDHGETEIDRRLARLRPAEQLVILADLQVGQRGAADPEAVVMDFDQHMGNLYPFSLNQKLEVITEPSPWYTAAGGVGSPWGRAVIPFEMISVLAFYSGGHSGFRARGPAVGLFAGQEIRMIDGPLFVGQPYRIEREIIALSESRRTESYWTRVRIRDADSDTLRAEVILNSATMKNSYARYAEEARALGKVIE